MLIKYLPGLSSLFCFSIFGLLAKDLYKYNIDGYIMFFYISLISFLYFLSSSIIKNKFNIKKAIKADKNDILLSLFNAGFLGIFTCGMASTLSLKYIDTGVQRAIVFSSAVYIIILEAIFYKRKLNISTIIYSFGMFGSLLLIAGNIKFDHGLKNTLVGLLIAFISAFAYAIYSLIAEKHPVKIPNSKVWIYAYITSMICSFTLIVTSGKLNQLNIFYNTKIIIEIILSSIICSGMAEDLMLTSIKKIGGMKTNAILALVPVSTLIVGMLFLGETITIVQFIGFLVLVVTTIKIK